MKIISLILGLFLPFFICVSNDVQLIGYAHDQNWSDGTNVWTTNPSEPWGPIWQYDWQVKQELNQSNNVSTVNVDFRGSPVKQITITNDTQFFYTNYIDGSNIALILINSSTNDVKLDWGGVLFETKAVTSLPFGKFLNAYISCHGTNLYVFYETWLDENDDVRDERSMSTNNIIDYGNAPFIIDTNDITFFMWENHDPSRIQVQLTNSTDQTISLIISPVSNDLSYWQIPNSRWDIIIEKYGWMIIILSFLLLIFLTLCMSWVLTRFIRFLNIQKHGWPPNHCDADGSWKGYDEDL